MSEEDNEASGGEGAAQFGFIRVCSPVDDSELVGDADVIRKRNTVSFCDEQQRNAPNNGLSVTYAQQVMC